jgi:IS30 family transposase
MPRLTEEKRKKIRELQEKGIVDAEISRMLGISYSTVHYQRPEVKERMRNYMRNYMREYRQKLDPKFQEFKMLLQEIEEGRLDSVKPEDNIYLSIVIYLSKSNGIKYKWLKREFGNVRGKMIKLRREGVVSYKDKRYWLKRELCELFSY